MNKSYIKNILRESLTGLNTEMSLGEAKDKEAKDKESNDSKPKKQNKGKIEAEYNQIKYGLEGIGAPTQADIMQLAGLGKVGDKTSESLFGKKLRREKNDEGGVYQFSDEERASVIKALATARK